MSRSWPAVILLLVLLAPCVEAGKFFVGAGAGQSSIRNTLQQFTVDGDDTGFKAFAGYLFIPQVYIEGAYTDFGSFEKSDGSMTLRSEAQNVALWGAGRVPIGRLFSFFVKLGVARTEADAVLDRPLLEPESRSDSDTSLSWGFGFGLNLGKHVTIRAEFEGYESDSVENLEFLSLGAQINF